MYYGSGGVLFIGLFVFLFGLIAFAVCLAAIHEYVELARKKGYRIEAGDSDTVYVYASVPNKIVKKTKKAVINWDLLTEELNTYYDGSLSHASYRIKK